MSTFKIRNSTTFANAVQEVVDERELGGDRNIFSLAYE